MSEKLDFVTVTDDIISFEMFLTELFRFVYFVLLTQGVVPSGLAINSRPAPEGYISKDIYIPYTIQKSGKRIFPYPFF
jgi:hypothetical protein